MDNPLNETLLGSDTVSFQYSDMGKHLGNMDKYLVDDNRGERLESIDEVCDNVGVNHNKNNSGLRSGIMWLCPCILEYINV
tara:strand:+ start:5629 stop:5871 length:243 start_codon:yes stop_codon:yes gene_type:complete